MLRLFSLFVALLLVVCMGVQTANAAPPKKGPPVKPPPVVDAGVPQPEPEAVKDDPSKWPQFRVAVMPFTGVNVKPELITFYTEHFGSALTANGVKVTTPAQIQAVLGLERQKQLLGCEEGSSCLAELGNALGVDGVVNANLALLDNTYRLNIKIVSAETGELLSSSAGSKSLKGQSAVADELSNAAKHMSRIAAGRARRKLGNYIPPTNLPPLPKETEVEKKPPTETVVEKKVEPPADAPVEKKEEVVVEAPKVTPPVVEETKKEAPPPKPKSNTGSVILMASGGVIAGVGAAFLAASIYNNARLRSGDLSVGSLTDANDLNSTALGQELLGYLGLGVGLPLFFIGFGNYDSAPPVKASFLLNSGGAGLVFEGQLP